VGPDTWAPVAEVLRARACQVVVPRLRDDGAPPWWDAHVWSVVDAVGEPTADSAPLVLVLHSGAGQLADHLVTRLDRQGHDVRAVLLVDAGVPTQGSSRLAQLRLEAPEVAMGLRELLDAGGHFPDWTDAQLRRLVPDGARRRRLLDGIRTLPAEYWDERIPTVDAPPHHTAALLLSGSYAATAEHAQEQRWPVIDLATDNHFLALAEEGQVAEHILRLIDLLLVEEDEAHQVFQATAHVDGDEPTR
jgi:hypothetical protein